MRCCYLFAALLGTLLFTSCGLNQKGSVSHANPGKHPKGTGPFDHNGNYVEAWADTPSKWSRKTSSPTRSIFEKPQPTEIASTATPDADPPKVDVSEQPPANAVPLPSGGESVAVKSPASTRTIAEAEVKRPASTTTKKPSVARNDDDKPVRKTTKVTASGTKAGTKTSKSGTLAKSSKSSKTSKSSTAAKTSSTSKTTVKTGSKTSKSSATASKSSAGKSKATARTTTPKAPKSKAKTSTVRYTVKKGESLAAIARRNKTTVTAIQKANGLKGATVPPGKTIVVPKY